MNTKTFAQQSRNILLEGVSKKLMYWGFDEKGNASVEPVSISGGYTFRGDAFDDPSVPELWRSLQNAIQTKGIDVVLEEAAYTWFNRIMALRILAKNGYEEPQLENARGLEHTPLILQRARQGQIDFLSAEEQIRLKKIINDYSKDQEAFAILLKGYCHNHRTLQRVFGRIDDYTELLLPDNMLQNDGFLHLVNTTDAISDEEYQEVELIGWLYQFYISEKKDEVFKSFKKNKKAEAKDIPAATQIFTPNWIVKYMVENTAGKIWLDHHPNSDLKSQMKYLVTNEEEQESSRNESKDLLSSVEELTLMDPACGSGHILVEGFHLLYQMYMEEYYTPEEAVESILKNNLYGLDIDDRAAQLANFAVLLKAAKVYPGIWQKDWLPNVYAMPEANPFTEQEVKDFLGENGAQFFEEVKIALDSMQDAKNLGSIMQFNLSDAAVELIKQRFEEISNRTYRDFNIEAIYNKLQAFIPPLLALTKKYTSVVANPPYMGQKSMNARLKEYVHKSYPMTKSDLMTIFMEVIPNLTADDSRFALINLPSWLFLSSFEKIRKNYIENFTFDSLLHMGRGIFGIDFGSVAFAIKKTTNTEAIGSYFRLHERNFQHIYYEDIEKLFLYSNNRVDYKYDFTQYRGDEGITEIPKQGTAKGLKLFYPNIPQTNFSKIPGSPIAYFLGNKIIGSFGEYPALIELGKTTVGLQTGENKLFVREWHETSFHLIGFNHTRESAKLSDKKWFPYNKGGGYKKWYGNHNAIVDWENDGEKIRNDKLYKLSIGKCLPGNSKPKNVQYYFKESISWSKVAAGGLGVRFFPRGFVFDVAGCSIFEKKQGINKYLLGLLNSNLRKVLIESISPTLNYEAGQLSKVPVKVSRDNEVNSVVNECIDFTKLDWDSRETSWDFEKSPLLNNSVSMTKAYQTWFEQVSNYFFQLHANEEELNRIFIDIYGLQEELTSEVALKDITILQEELDRSALVALEPTFREQGAAAIELPIDKGEVVSQFISYAIGLFMGRYRLDKPGLHIAHPNPSQQEIASYQYNGQTVTIDEDAILPIMGTGCNFKDDALQQIYGLLDTIWGPETRTENLNFIQECLNKDLEKFLVKDFYKYHCGMYKKKPIYWLFASPKGAFQVLVYMHRMNAFTVEKIRDNYLLEHIKNLEGEISLLESNELNLNTQDRKKLEQLRKDLIECQDYEVELKDIADKQITFDLDDGVTENYKLFESVVAKIR